MMDQGLVEEARKLYPFRENNALNTVGYRELFEHFEGKTSLGGGHDPYPVQYPEICPETTDLVQKGPGLELVSPG